MTTEPTIPAEAPTLTYSETPAEAAPAAEAPASDAVVAAPVSEGSPKAAAETPPVSEAPAPASEGSEALTPESYTFTPPEGMALDEAISATFRSTLAKNGVPPAAAQPLLDLYAETLRTSQAAQIAEFNATQTRWLSEINSIPEFKEGPTREKSLIDIGRVVDTYGTPELREVLNLPQIGNNPAVAKFFQRIAAELSEGTPVPASRPAPAGKSKSFGLSYPNTPEINQG